MNATAGKLLTVIRSYGSDARDLRDASHEACHALEAKVPRGSWDRNTIHDKLVAKARRALLMGALVGYEIQARAVEQIVCAKLDVKCGTVEEWAAVACLETVHAFGLNLPSAQWFAERVETSMTGRSSQKMAEQVIALANARPRKARVS